MLTVWPPDARLLLLMEIWPPGPACAGVGRLDRAFTSGQSASPLQGGARIHRGCRDVTGFFCFCSPSSSGRSCIAGLTWVQRPPSRRRLTTIPLRPKKCCALRWETTFPPGRCHSGWGPSDERIPSISDNFTFQRALKTLSALCRAPLSVRWWWGWSYQAYWLF